MKQIAFILFISIVLACGISSCKKDGVTEPDLGYNYFPNQVGKYVTYDVDSFYYRNSTTIDTFKFQLKEKIQSIYSDNQNRPTIRLERYVKYYNPAIPYSAMPWILRNVWAENRTATTAEKVEENTRFIKLNFPVKKSKTWNGNVQNTNGAMDYTYSFVDASRTIVGNTFDSTLQVEQQNYLDLITQKYYIEQYAKNVGLVYKKVIDIQSQPDPLWTDPAVLSAFYAIPILQRVTSGNQYTWIVNSFGSE